MAGLSEERKASILGAWRYHRSEFVISAVAVAFYYLYDSQVRDSHGKSVIMFIAFVSPFISLARFVRSAWTGRLPSDGQSDRRP